MKRTANETQAETLSRFIDAADREHPVTITYLKEEKDEAGKKTGRMVETVRTIEVYDVITTKAGNITLKAMDRETGESRTFRLDRIVAYTTHRTAYTVEPEAVEADAPEKDEMVVSTEQDVICRELAREDLAYWNDRHDIDVVAEAEQLLLAI